MVKRLQRARLVAVLLLLCGHAQAAEAPAAESTSAAPPGPPGPKVRFIAAARYDLGVTQSLQVPFPDGHTEALKANGGVLSAGVAIRPTASPSFDLRATFGIKYGLAASGQGSFRYLAFPLEILAALNFVRARLSTGACISLSPKYQGTSVTGGPDLELRNSLALVAQAEWITPVRTDAASVSFGLRFALERQQLQVGGPVTDANTLGLLVGVTL